MAASLDQEGGLTQEVSNEKGGLKTILFTMGSDFFGRIAVTGLLPQMILYLTREYHLNPATATVAMFVWAGMTNFAPILGGFLSDSYFGRFRMIVLGSVTSLTGMILICSTATLPSAKPSECKNPSLHPCESPTTPQLALLFFAFTLVSFGAGCIRPCSLAFGATQLDKQNNTKKEKLLQSLFKWYYPLVGVSFITAVTFIPYLQEAIGWGVSFGILVLLMGLTTILFLLGSPLYITKTSNKSLLTEFAQVIAAALKNRHLVFPPDASNGCYHHQEYSKLVSPTERFRFLNKACIIKNHENIEKDLDPYGSPSNSWSLSTVEQVEDLKSVFKVIPIWSTGIIFAVTVRQHALLVLQCSSMDRQIGSTEFQIPPGSISLFSIIALMVTVAIYDGLIAPQRAKFSGRTRGVCLKQRMGVGLILSSAAMAVAAIVEAKRQKTAIRQGFEYNNHAVVNMSAMWLAPQLCLIGVAEACNVIGQMEFYYSELSKRLPGIGVVLFSLGMGVGNFLAGLIVLMVDVISKSLSKESWVSRHLNRSHHDYYYWILATLAFINFVYFIACSWAHGEEGESRYWEEEEEQVRRVLKDQEMYCRSRELAIIL